MQKQLSPREKSILCLTGILSVLVVALELVVLPLADRNRFLDTHIALTRSKLGKNLYLLQQKDLLQDFVKQTSREMTVSGEARDPVVELLSELQSLAKDAGLAVTDIRPQGDGVSLKSGMMFVAMRMEGSAKSYFQFMNAVENSLSMLTVKKYLLSVRQDAGTLEGELLISAGAYAQ